MSIKKTLILLSILPLSSCFTTYWVSDDEAIRVGKEETITTQCLKNYSYVPELKNLYALPDVGIGGELKAFSYTTIGNTVFGAARFNHIRRDGIFHQSVEFKKDLIAQGRNLGFKPTAQNCKPYLDLYENAYRRLKAQGY